MQWLITLDSEQDLIVACRLMNVFRRKGLKITAQAMTARPGGFSLMAMVESSEPGIDHLFNLVRRMEGVERVAYYRHETSTDASFVFIDAGSGRLRMADFEERFRESRLVFASHGKYLLELPAESRSFASGAALDMADALPLACVKTAGLESRAASVPA